jgi:hypothetical protein
MVEMVQKTAAIGAPLIVAVSAPTALALRTAETAGTTLVAPARASNCSRSALTKPAKKLQSMSLDKLWCTWPIRSASSQQGKERSKRPPELPITSTSFCDPRMRAQIFAHLEAGGKGLDPVAREAVEKLTAAERN